MMTSTYKIMDITKDKQLIGQEITLIKANSKTVKSKYVTHKELNEALAPIQADIQRILKKIGA